MRRAGVVFVLFAGVAVGDAQGQTKRPLELADFYRIESVSDPQISPDGRQVAFVRSVIVEDDNARRTEIWLAPADGSAPPARITTPAFNASAPRWSPDGALLAFSSRRPVPTSTAQSSSIWFLRMDRPGGEAFQIAGVDGTPVFSPDNKWIAFTRETPPEARPKPAASDFEKKIADRFKGRVFDWMNYRFDGRGYLPDPREPSVTPARDLYIVPRDIGTPGHPGAGTAPRRVVSMGVDVQDFAWRPDSQAIAFIANTHQRDEYLYDRADVWVVALAAGNTTLTQDRSAGATETPSGLAAAAAPGTPRRLTDDGFDHDSVAWSPDGATLFFRRQMGLTQVIASKQQHGAPVDIYRLAVPRDLARDFGLRAKLRPTTVALAEAVSPATATSMRPQNLTGDWDLLPSRPMVSADGRRVYFSAGTSGNEHLFSVAATGGAVQQLTRGDRQLGSFSASRSFDRWAFTATDARHPAEVYVNEGSEFAATSGGEGSPAVEKRISAFNDTLLNQVEIQPAERILARSNDGTQIEGWILKPRAATDGARWPLILAMHGGPHGAYGNNFAFQHQLWAANGYAVLYTNPRGSTGYGEKFLWGTWGGWGNRDFEDVMAVVDESIKRFPVDERRMGATGYSYGGFLANWVITQTSRFAAAIVGAGISNWVSDYGTADIPRTKESEFNGPPWETASLELLMKQSPIVYARNVTTPTMFIHGEADLRVPIEQAEQMYVALKKRRIPAQFIRYPDMYHGGIRSTATTMSCNGGAVICRRSRERPSSVSRIGMESGRSSVFPRFRESFVTANLDIGCSGADGVNC